MGSLNKVIQDVNCEVLDINGYKYERAIPFGAQPKFKYDNYVYKEDTCFNESVSEVICSILNSCIVFNYDYVNYKQTVWSIGDFHNAQGCKSKNFIPEGYEEFLLGELLCSTRFKWWPDYDRLCEFIEQLIGENPREHLSRIFTIDALVLNNDRHFNNINFLRNLNTGKVTFAPLYDFGRSFCMFPKPAILAPTYEEQLKLVGVKMLYIDREMLTDRLNGCTKLFALKRFRRNIATLNRQLDKYEDILWKDVRI